MTTQEQIQRVTDIAQEKGWSVSLENEGKSSIELEFQRYTNFGQDFIFNAEIQNKDIETLIDSIRSITRALTPTMKPTCGLERTDTAETAHRITSRI